MLFPLLLSLISAQASSCAESDQFTISVQRAGQGAVDGIVIRIEAGGSRGVRETADTVKEGLVRVCVFRGEPGEFVIVRVAQAVQHTFRLLYPPGGRVPLSHQGSPEIVVCEIDRDCDLNAEVADRVVRRVKPLLDRLGTEERQALFARWRDDLDAQGVRRGALVEALQRKERQIASSRAASELLSRFDVRAREVIDRFRHFAGRALDYPSGGPVEQIKEAIADYSPVFLELREKSDAYRKSTADAWGADVSRQFQGLVDEALAIHAQLYRLNDITTLVNDCRNGWNCPDREAARARVQEGADSIAVDVDRRLVAFGRRKRAFLEHLDGVLFEPVPVPPGGPSSRRPRTRQGGEE